MSVSQHRHYDPQMTQNQKNQMSDDPKDGARGSDTLGGKAPGDSPERDAQDQERIEEFGRQGAGAQASATPAEEGPAEKGPAEESDDGA